MFLNKREDSMTTKIHDLYLNPEVVNVKEIAKVIKA